MGLVLQGLLLSAFTGLIMYHILTIDDNKRDVKKLKVHTHAADGSINGIRGWY